MRKAISILLHFVVSYVMLMLARVVYVAENHSTFATLFADNSLWQLLKGSLLFDTSLLMYVNSIVVLMIIFLPARRLAAVTWVYALLNGLCMVMNLADAVYFKYTGHRTTMSVFSEFSNEGNLGKVMLTEVASHWYLFVIGIVLIAATWWLSHLIMRGQAKSMMQPAYTMQSAKRRHTHNVVLLLIYVPLCIFGIRGGVGRAVRPVTISNANQYVSRPSEAAVVLNTPFSMLRTIGKSAFKDPAYFSADELDGIYSPVHNVSAPDSMPTVRRKNVVVLIVESFGREYIGALNRDIEDGQYKGYTPFVDSLCTVSLTIDHSFANGRKSIDGMPSILSGIPHFVEPFFLTPASMNDVGGLATTLGQEGYETAFFHGATNGSMGFEAFAKATGFSSYYGRTEYGKDSRFGGDKDFDGTWAIWDEPFLQYYALAMNDIRQPFMTTVFTASSHHPYKVPEAYASVYRDEPLSKHKSVIRDDNPIHKCIRYTDEALRRFFATASQQPWYKNTIFVITSDHTNVYDHAEYGTDLGLFTAPLLFFDPSGEMPRGMSESIGQQTDIMPTVLSWLGYQKPYVAWGVDLLSTPASETWAVSYINGIYQYVCGDHLIQFDGQKVTAVYAWRTDRLLQHNLLPGLKNHPDINAYERRLKAIIQSYMQRMVNNELVVR